MVTTINEQRAEDYVQMAGFEGDWRDSWWNDDFLRLLGHRTDLARRERLLDVGCGVGHWGQRLLPLAHPEATLVGVDREGQFLDAAEERAEQLGLADRTHWRPALAESLPFPDNHFDAVTCQTVLMHATDAGAVVREMRRVLSPGGLLLLAEPDNTVNAVSPDRGEHNPSVAETLALIELQMVCARGKRALGHGDETVGSKLHALVAAESFESVQSWINDRAAPLIPPYIAPTMGPEADAVLRFAGAAEALEDRARAHWQAGGGTQARFDALWPVRVAWGERVQRQVLEHTFTRGGGFLVYVCAAEKAA